MKQQNGFTIIELLIATTVIAILAAIAIPVYFNFTARAKVAEPLAVASGAKQGVATYAVLAGHLPDSNAQASLPAPESYQSKYLKQLRVDRSVRRRPHMRPQPKLWLRFRLRAQSATSICGASWSAFDAISGFDSAARGRIIPICRLPYASALQAITARFTRR